MYTEVSDDFALTICVVLSLSLYMMIAVQVSRCQTVISIVLVNVLGYENKLNLLQCISECVCMCVCVCGGV